MPLKINDLKDRTQEILSQQIFAHLKKKYDNHLLSLVERIQIIKSFVLPKLLYVFRVLPIWLQSSCIIKWQKACVDFVWSHKIHRIAFKHMKRPLRLRGLAVPDVKLYFHASILAGLIKLYNSNYKSKWKQLENSLIHPSTFSEILWNSKASLTDPAIQTSFCVWKQ